MKSRVKINHSKWNREKGLRITIYTDHSPETRNHGLMFSVDEARQIGTDLLTACDEVEKESRKAKQLFLDLGKKLGFIE